MSFDFDLPQIITFNSCMQAGFEFAFNFKELDLSSAPLGFNLEIAFIIIIEFPSIVTKACLTY